LQNWRSIPLFSILSSLLSFMFWRVLMMEGKEDQEYYLQELILSMWLTLQKIFFTSKFSYWRPDLRCWLTNCRWCQLRSQRSTGTLAGNQLLPNASLKCDEKTLIDLVDGLSSSLIIYFLVEVGLRAQNTIWNFRVPCGIISNTFKVKIFFFFPCCLSFFHSTWIILS
jgi:hypothetical protein